VLVNNAGVGGPQKPIGEITAEEWDATVNINLRAVFFCTRYAVPALRAAQGSIVNVASILGLGGRGTGLSLYCASKGGVVNLTRDLAIELAPDIRVNCVCPGAVDTDMLQELGRALGDGDVAAGYAKLTQGRPMKRVAKPAEIANAILWLASDLASFTTGAIQAVDGGVAVGTGNLSIVPMEKYGASKSSSDSGITRIYPSQRAFLSFANSPRKSATVDSSD
jgi:NAD(P)-dependent dehydrogenase (short-subunit alcohol dehydrogenase family)